MPGGTQLRQLQPLRHALASNPDDLEAALKLSRAWLEAGRRDGDPRFLSYAQATLAPWVRRTDASVDALTLMATSLQSLHRFDEALLLLERALHVDPRNAQAWLTSATVQQVRGNFDAARTACVHLIGVTDQNIALACIASAQSMNGKLRESYQTLSRIAADDARLSVDVRSWLLGQHGAMAVRLGDDAVAEQDFKAALQANPDDLYVKGELADLLLRQSRNETVIDLLKDNEPQDALLLRLAIAGKHSGTAAGRRWDAMYATRYQAALRDGDSTHSREHARYLLEVRDNAIDALRMAQQNWQVQREPADIRIYWRAATAARSHDLKVIDNWIDQNNYQDATLDRPSSSVTGRTS